MKTLAIFLSFLFASTVLQAQDYQISFSGSGQSTSVDSIKVENLTQGTTLSLNGDDVLFLVETVGINTLPDNGNAVKIYPNPMITSAIVEIFYSNTQTVCLEIFNDIGALIARQSTMVQQGRQRFEILGLKAGVYSVNVRLADWEYTANLISLGKYLGNTTIKHQSNNAGPAPENDLKSTKDLVQMQYNDGEMILFKGYAGNYTRVLTLLPTQSQTIDFEFIPCSDEDGNNYAVVTIGAQTWMAENLKTTKFSDGTYIPHVTENAAWSNLSTPAYCWYDNDQSTYSNTYGALYNWYTVGTGNLCPTGWYVPTDAEYTALADYLGGLEVAGGKIKETGTTHWNGPNVGATNETGFTGLPGGSRTSSGTFDYFGNNGFWWSSTEYASYNAWYYYLYSVHTDLYRYNIIRRSGFSVRCLKNN